MECNHLISIPNPKKGVKGNVSVPCGRCGQCTENLRNQWTYRLQQEEKASLGTFFLTLTTSDENIEYSERGYPTITKTTCQTFIKRTRAFQQRNTKLNIGNWKREPDKSRIQNNYPTLRYYIVGEYGTQTDRPHYHAILFNCHISTINELPKLWPQGNIHHYICNEGNLHYITKFHTNKHYHKITHLNLLRQRPFSLMSKVPPIGNAQIMLNKDFAKAHNHLTHNGFKVGIPNTFKKKFFTKTNLERKQVHNTYERRIRETENLQKLSKLHNDPETEHQNRKENQSKQLIKRANKGDKL